MGLVFGIEAMVYFRQLTAKESVDHLDIGLVALWLVDHQPYQPHRKLADEAEAVEVVLVGAMAGMVILMALMLA